MNKDDKNIIIDELIENLKEYQYVYVTDSSKLSATSNNDLRKLLHKNGVKMQVIKNTFVHKALEKSGTEWGELKDTLVGTTALLFASNPKSPAIAIKEFRNYKWKEDKNGNILNQPEDKWNHFIDSLRYGVYTKLARPNYGKYAIR